MLAIVANRGDGIKGKDSLTIQSGPIKIVAGGDDGLQSSKEASTKGMMGRGTVTVGSIK